MDRHTLQVLLDAGYVLTILFAFAVAASNVMLERLAHQPKKSSLAFATLFALGLILTVYMLFSDMSSSFGINAPVRASEMTGFAYLFGQLILPLILGTVFAFDNIRRLKRLHADRQRLLKQLQVRTLALNHPEAAATVEALTTVLEKQSRTGLLQSIWLGAIFYVLGVITPYIIGGMSR